MGNKTYSLPLKQHNVTLITSSQPEDLFASSRLHNWLFISILFSIGDGTQFLFKKMLFVLRLLLLRGFSLLAGAGVTLVARPGLLFVASLVAEPRPQGRWA